MRSRICYWMVPVLRQYFGLGVKLVRYDVISCSTIDLGTAYEHVCGCLNAVNSSSYRSCGMCHQPFRVLGFVVQSAR